MRTEPLRAIVVGAGHLGRHHARILADTEGVRLVTVVDPDRERGCAVADQTGARWVASVEALAEPVDIAAVAAPTTVHLQVAGPLLEHGVACLVEKPLAATAEEARALVELASSTRSPLLVGHVERFNPVLDHLPASFRPKAVVARREAPYTGRSTDVSVVHDLMVHDLDLCFSWIDARPTRFQAAGGIVHGPRLDWAVCRIEFDGGVSVHLHASRVAGAPERSAWLYGERDVLFVDFQRRRLRVLGAGGDREYEGSPEEPLRRELEHFVDCVREGKPPRVGGREGLAAVEWADRIEAAALGRA